MKKNKTQLKSTGISLSVERIGSTGVMPQPVVIAAVAVIAAIAVMGALITFVTILNISTNISLLCILTAALSAGFVICWQVVKRRGTVIGITVGAVLLACAVMWRTVYEGVLSVYYQGFTTISKYMYWDTPKIPDGAVVENDPSVALVLCAVAVLLCLFVSYFLAVVKSIIGVFLVTFPFFEIGAAFGCVPEYFWFSLYLGAMAAAFVYIRANKTGSKKQRTKRQGEIGKSNLAIGAVIAAAATVAVFFGGRYVLNNLGFDRPENMDKMRKNVKNGYSSIYDYIVGEDHDGSLKEGKLLKVDDKKVKNRHYLTLKTSLQKTDEIIYLRGYSATDYKGTSWEQSESYEKYTKLFSELEENFYRLSGINGSLLSNCPDYRTFDQGNFKISDLRREKDYAYQTYCASFDESYTEIYDSAMSPKNKGKYEYNTYLGTDAPFKIRSSRLYKDKTFKKLFSQYKTFVKKEYVKSTATDSVKQLAEKLKSGNKYKSVDNVREYLKKNIKLTYVVDKSPADEDFVEHLLFTSKRGYSTHYATAAAVMLQAMGYPTRYVEGYAILPKQFNETKTDNKYGYITYDVTDANAHAWIEIFDDTYGWIPVDVTPGMYSATMFDMMKQYVQEGIDEEKPPKDEETKEENIEEEQPPEEEEDGPDDLLYGEETHYIYIEAWHAVLIIVFLSLAVLFVLWLVMARIIAKIRKRKMISAESDNAAAILYRYFIKLLEYDGIDVKTVSSYRELLENIENYGGAIDVETARLVIAVCQQYAFSRTKPYKVAVSGAATRLVGCTDGVYRKLKPKKRFSFKYIGAM